MGKGCGGILSLRLPIHSCDLTLPICLGIICPVTGEVPEWLNGTVSKTVVVLVATVGSNPTLSA